MASSFSISRSRFSAFSDSALIDEIRLHTSSETEASSILGCMERLGDDPSIRYYEMTPKQNHRTYRDAPPVAWSVRAVRP
jgi:hypothetical protein